LDAHHVDFMKDKKHKNYFSMYDSRIALTLHDKRNRIKEQLKILHNDLFVLHYPEKHSTAQKDILKDDKTISNF